MNSSVVIKLIFEQNSKQTVLFELIDNENNFYIIAEKLRDLYIDVAVVISKSADKLDYNLENYKNEIISYFYNYF